MTNVFAQGGTPITGGGLPTEGTGIAPGSPVAPASCGDMTAAVNRLQFGLPAIDEAITRTQNILQGGMEEKAGAEVDLAMTGIQQAAEGVTEIASQSDAVANQLENLQQALLNKGVSQTAITRSVEMIKNLKESALHWQDLRDSYNAGNALGTSLQGATTHISQQYQAFNKFLGDSGIYNALGNQTAEAAAGLLGPEAILATKVTEVVTDVGYALGKGYLAQQDINNAQQTLATLSESRSRVTSDIDSLNTSIGQFCAPQSAANPPSSPLPIPPPEALNATTSASSGGGSAAPWIIGGIVVVAGIAGGAAYASGAFNGGGSGGVCTVGQCEGETGSNPCGSCNPQDANGGDVDCPGGGICFEINCDGSPNHAPFCSAPSASRKIQQRDRLRTSLKALGFERFLDRETLPGIGNEHRLASGYGAGTGHRAARRKVRGNAYSLSSSVPEVDLQDGIGAASGGSGFNSSSLPGVGRQNHSGAASLSGGFNSSIASAYVPSWSQRIDDHWTVNGKASPSWSGVEPTLTIERQLDSGGSLYGEYAGNYSYESMPSHALDAGALCRLTDSQELNFDAGVGLNGNLSTRYVRFGYTFDLDKLY